MGIPGTIDEEEKSIEILLPYGTQLTSLVPTFTTTGTSVTVEGEIQISGTSIQDFTNPVVYTVTAEDGTSVQYTVTVPYPVLYVTNSSDGTVSVINGLNGTVLKTVPVGTQPVGLCINSDTRKIYVANKGDGTVTVLDGSTNTVLTTISLTGTDPQMVAIYPELNKVYVAYEYYDDLVEIIDGATDTVVGSYATSGNYPVGMAVNPVSGKIYIVLWGDSSVDVVNGVTDTFLANISVINSYELGGIAVDPLKNLIYIPNVSSTGELQVIDGNTDTVSGTVIGVGNTPIAVAVDTEQSRVYVVNQGSGTVSVIDSESAMVMTTVPVGTNPIGIAVSEKHSLVYVVNQGDATVSVLDGKTYAVLDTIPVGSDPLFIDALE
ncbi:MAG: hypothetical protein Kow009_12560 [Spirochaetales bacterium]